MKKASKKILVILLCLLMISGTFVMDIGTVKTEAAEPQKAMFIFKNTLYVTCNVANHAYKSSYPYRKPIDIIDNVSGDGNAYAPFDCKVVGKFTSEGNTVAFESLEKVQFADGTIDYMTFMLSHDNNISNISVGNTYTQGSVIYQEGNAGTSAGTHIHLEVARGAYSKRSSSSQSIWAFVRGQYNAIYPNNAFYLYEGTKISNNGGYSWKVATSTYTLYYDANGGSGAPAAQTGATSYQVSSVVPYRFGYNFIGWTDSPSNTSSWYSSSALLTLSGDKTLYALWKENDITNTLSIGGDIRYDEKDYYKFVPSVTAIYTFKTGSLSGNLDPYGTIYNSSGTALAYNDDGGGERNFSLSYNMTAGITYYLEVRGYSGSTGYYSLYIYDSLYYDANGGTNAPEVQTGNEFYTISYATPTRENYTFLGWSTSSNATTAEYKAGDSIQIFDPTTLYAVWQKNAHTHHYVLTDSFAATCTTDGYKEYTCSCDDKYTTITEYALGHDFSDYDIELAHPHYSIYRCSRSGCSEISRTSETNYDINCSQCNPTTYTVSYNANGGSGAPSSQTKKHGVSLTLTSSVPAKSYTITYNANGGSVSPSSKAVNCKFLNWNTAQNGSGTSYKSGATCSANSNVTLYAQYATPTAGSLATPTRSGYTFDGWYTAASGGTKVTASTVISKNTTVYAHWTKKAEPTTKPAVTLSSISVKTNPSKTAYTVGETFNSSGLSLTAKYSDGTSKTITSGFTCSKPDMTTAGTKKVTVTYQGKTTSFNITVKEAVAKATSVDIYVIEEFNGTNTAKIGATVNPSNASYKSITWTSSDTSVATVDSEGTIKTYNAGVAIITVTVTNHDGTTVSDTIEVTVNGGNNSDGGFLGFILSMLELLFLPFTFLFELIFGIF